MTRMFAARPIFPTWASGLLVAAFWALGPSAAAAQSEPAPRTWSTSDVLLEAADWSDQIPAHLAVVDGTAWLERDGSVEPAQINVALLAGDLVGTDVGRVEILFADGSVIDLDQDTRLELLSDSLVRLLAGRMHVVIARGGTSELDYRIDAAGATTWIRTAGEYDLEVLGDFSARPEVRVVVTRGIAELESAGQWTRVQSGFEASAGADLPPSRPFAASLSTSDPFGRWVTARRAARISYQSAQYLPPEIQYYSGALARGGAWEYNRLHGYVWYPRVGLDWRPYYDGRWTVLGSFGWFWVGASSWSWPTHHYGRWGRTSGRWYWIPDRRWGPAWVGWASTPGYVGWSPLGYDNRPVLSLSVSTASAWVGWTFVPSRTLGPNFLVRRHAVVGRQWVGRDDPRFIRAPRVPVSTTQVDWTPRPLRGPTSSTRVAVPRDGGFRAVGQPVAPRAGTLAPGRIGGATSPSRSGSVVPGRSGTTTSGRAVVTPRAGGTVTGTNGRAIAPPARSSTGATRVNPTPQPGQSPSSPTARPTARPRVQSTRPPASSPPARTGQSPPSAGSGPPQRTQPTRQAEPPRASAPERNTGSGRQAAPRPSAPRAAPGQTNGRQTPSRSGNAGSGRAAPPQPSAPRADPGQTNGRQAPSGSGSTRRAVPRARAR